MSEYELWDLANTVVSNMFAEQALFVTMVSAYLLVAYSVGKSLTSYQIIFVNILFIMIVLAGTQGQLAMLGFAYDFRERLNEFTSTTTALAFSETRQYVVIIWIGIRVMLTIGALVFMWQVRHPKTK